MPNSRLLVAAIALAVALGACRNPDVREDAIVQAPDTTVVEGPFYDTDEMDPADRPMGPQGPGEVEAQRTIAGDVNTLEAQVIVVDDRVRITAVLDESGAGMAERKAEQFIVAAARHIERTGGDPGPEVLGPTRLAYEVTLRDEAGNEVFRGTKPPEASVLDTRGAG